MKKDSSTKSWELIAQDWAKFSETNDYRNFFLIPHTMELIGDVEGKAILDLGCGEGGYARILSQKGARVTAVDGAPQLIKVAKEKAKSEGLSITYLVRNAKSLDGINDDFFDIVLAAMSLMDVEDYENAIAEVWRVLKPGGELLMSISHPCFTGRDTGWKKDRSGRLFFTANNYFDKTPWEDFVNPKKFKHKVIFRHRPLHEIINPFLSRGFKMMKLYEPVPTSEQMKQSHRLPRLTRIPMFLFIKWRKESKGIKRSADNS